MARTRPVAQILLGGFLLAIVSFLALTLAVTLFCRRAVVETFDQAVSSAFESSAQQVRRELDKYESLAYALVTYDAYQALNLSDIASPRTLWQFRDATQTIGQFRGYGELNADLAVYFQRAGRAISALDGYSELDEEAKEQLAAVRSMGREARWTGGGGLGRPLMYLVVSATSLASNRDVKCVVSVGERELNRLLSVLSLNGQGEAFMYFLDTGKPVSDLKDSALSAALEREMRSGAFRGEIQCSKERYTVLCQPLGDCGLGLGFYVSYQALTQPIARITRWILAAFAAFLLIALGYARLLYRQMVRPVGELSAAMEGVRDGNFSVRVSGRYGAEFQRLGRQFNWMVERIEQLIHREYLNKINKQQLELKLLQSQIDPHFLFNSLNYIYQVAASRGQDQDLAQMALYLTEYFRYSTQMWDHEPPLSRELRSIESYVGIYRMRFPGKIGYCVSVEPGVEDTPVPRLLIQPIVENALVHGLEGGRRAGMLYLNVRKTGEMLVITVENDGVALADGPLEELNERMRAPFDIEADRQFGLRNVYWRIRLSYGERAQIRLMARAAGGVAVRMELPLAGREEVGA